MLRGLGHEVSAVGVARALPRLRRPVRPRRARCRSRAAHRGARHAAAGDRHDHALAGAVAALARAVLRALGRASGRSLHARRSGRSCASPRLSVRRTLRHAPRVNPSDPSPYRSAHDPRRSCLSRGVPMVQPGRRSRRPALRALDRGALRPRRRRHPGRLPEGGLQGGGPPGRSAHDHPLAVRAAARRSRRDGKDPRVIEVILRETKRIVRMDSGHLIVETGPGLGVRQRRRRRVEQRRPEHRRAAADRSRRLGAPHRARRARALRRRDRRHRHRHLRPPLAPGPGRLRPRRRRHAGAARPARQQRPRRARAQAHHHRPGRRARRRRRVW